MNNYLRFFLLIAVLSGSLTVSAHLHGVVLDDQGEPLAGANVWWAETTIGTTTDAEGIFEIEPVRQTKLLVTSFLGYCNDTTRVKDRSTIMVVLIPDDQQLDEVTVEARRQSVIKSRYSAFDVQSFGQGELCRAACCNLSESFETSASVDVSYADAATGAKQIKLLGLSGTYVQLLTENTPAVRGLAQNFGMEYIPGPWMDAVQISKGTSSVINGYEAITGQINVEYLKPQTQEPVAVNLMLNKELHAEVNLTGGWDIPIPDDPMLGTLSTGVLAHYQEGAWPMDDNMDGVLDMPTNRNLNLLNRWYYKNDEYTFQFLARGLHDERHGGQRDNYMMRKMGRTLPANPYLIDLRTDRVEGFMKNGIVFDEESGMSLGIIAAGSYHDQMNTYGRSNWKASQANGYLNAIFQNTWSSEHHHHHHHGEAEHEEHDESHELSHKLSAGVSVNYDRYWETVNLFNGTDLPANLGRQEVTPGIFAEYTFTHGENLSVIAGLRGDWSSMYGAFVTPRLNIRYAPFEWWTLRGSVGLGYRSPNIIADNAAYLVSTRSWDMYSPIAAGDTYQQHIHQERSMNAGLTTVFDIPVGQRNLQISAEYYYTRFFESMLMDLDCTTGAPHRTDRSLDGGVARMDGHCRVPLQRCATDVVLSARDRCARLLYLARESLAEPLQGTDNNELRHTAQALAVRCHRAVQRPRTYAGRCGQHRLAVAGSEYEPAQTDCRQQLSVLHRSRRQYVPQVVSAALGADHQVLAYMLAVPWRGEHD